MKLVFFDLQRSLPPSTRRKDDSVYSTPLAFSANQAARARSAVQTANLYYNSTVMNFYGDSFHVTTPGYNYVWNYVPADSNRMVVNAARVNSELDNKTYEPRQVKVASFQTSSSCQLVRPAPTSKPWPTTCDDINDAAIHGATDGGAVGFMLLNGKRLGNLSAMEAIPNQAILGFRNSQVAALGATIAGEIIWNAGSRDGVGGTVHKDCRTNSLVDCYIGRFGWVGDRVSLEDQVANAAFVEMNMTTKDGYKRLYGNSKVLLRYGTRIPIVARPTRRVANRAATDCPNDVELMADYARWLGNPTRSSSRLLCRRLSQARNLRQLKCDTCHVIRKIDIVPDDTMLTKDFRDRLATRQLPILVLHRYRFITHDMGYLSQVGNASGSIRDPRHWSGKSGVQRLTCKRFARRR
jgi:hypothetical protein